MPSATCPSSSTAWGFVNWSRNRSMVPLSGNIRLGTSQKYISFFLQQAFPKSKPWEFQPDMYTRNTESCFCHFYNTSYPFSTLYVPGFLGIPACCIANTEEYTKQPVFRQFTFGHLEFQPCFNLLSFHLFPLLSMSCLWFSVNAFLHCTM